MKQSEKQAFEYIQKYYDVPAEIGRKIKTPEGFATIVGAERQYITIEFDNGIRQLRHPTWEIEYSWQV